MSTSRKFIQNCFRRITRIRTAIYTLGITPLFNEAAKGCRISPPFRHSNLHQIRLGSDVIINRDCWIGVVNEQDDEDTTKLWIGADSAIGMGATISAALSIVLEDHVLLARNVYISDHGHEFSNIEIPIKHQGITKPQPVKIGRSTWLGQNVVVLPGVTIGEHCVIGANSVVRSSIPAYSVAVGVPARVVRRFNPASAQWEKCSS